MSCHVRPKIASHLLKNKALPNLLFLLYLETIMKSYNETVLGTFKLVQKFEVTCFLHVLVPDLNLDCYFHVVFKVVFCEESCRESANSQDLEQFVPMVKNFSDLK